MNGADMVHDGKEYYISLHFIYKYNLSKNALQRARKNGLPYIKVRGVYFYNEQEFHDYYAGRIGNDIERRAQCDD